jgi:hypothetical protein
LVEQGLRALQSLMDDCARMNHATLQWLTRCVTPWTIDRAFGDMKSDSENGPRLATYARYNVLLEQEWLKTIVKMECGPEKLADLAQMDNPDGMEELAKVGVEAAKLQVEAKHFDAFVISVGNLTLGGTGKTPIVSYIARYLTREDRSVTVLTRGYGRKSKGRRVLNAASPDQGSLPSSASYEEFGDEPALGPFGVCERCECLGVIVVRPRSRQRTRRAQLSDGCLLDQPVAFGQMKVGAQLVRVSVDEAGVGALLPRCDDQQRHIRKGEPQRALARQAHRVLERQVLAAFGADEITHGPLRPRTAPRRPRRR